MIRKYPDYLLIFIAFSFIFAAVFAVARQILRSEADDPQIYLSRDAAASLDDGKDVRYLVSSDKIKLPASSAPFVIVYGNNRVPIESGAFIDGNTPVPPSSSFERTEEKGEYRFTWRPLPGLKIAAVMNRFSQGYVLSGRSLQETDKRIAICGYIAASFWLFVALLFLGAYFWNPIYIKRRLLHRFKKKGRD